MWDLTYKVWLVDLIYETKQDLIIIKKIIIIIKIKKKT